MSKVREMKVAQSMRRKGWSIKDIARELNVSRSSASVWCQGIDLTESQKVKLKKKQVESGAVGRQKGADTNKLKKKLAVESAREYASKSISCISREELFYLGLGIYWGEGVKSRSGQSGVVNSDARILKVAIRWYEECFGVSKELLRPYVYISESHRYREKVIMDYWVRSLCLKREQFKSPIYLKGRPKEKYENHDSYYGVVSLRVPKSTNLKYRILALLDEVGKRLE
jgi:hypothetical protein